MACSTVAAPAPSTSPGPREREQKPLDKCRASRRMPWHMLLYLPRRPWTSTRYPNNYRAFRGMRPSDRHLFRWGRVRLPLQAPSIKKPRQPRRWTSVDKPRGKQNAPGCLRNRSIQPCQAAVLRSCGALQRLGGDVEHRLLGLDQHIQAALKCIRRWIRDPELLGRLAGCFVLFGVIVEGFLLGCHRLPHGLLKKRGHAFRYFRNRSSLLFREVGYGFALLDCQIDGAFLSFDNPVKALTEQVE